MHASPEPTAAETAKALRLLADLMETDKPSWMSADAPMPLDSDLYMRACYGPLIYWNAQVGQYRFHRDHWTDPAKRHAAEALVTAVCQALGAWDPNHPDRYSPFKFTVSQVRAAADRIDT